MKNGKIPGEDNINSELYEYAPEEFKLRILQFLHTIYTKKLYSKCIEKCHCNPIIYESWQKRPKNYRGISILCTCCKIYSEILYI